MERTPTSSQLSGNGTPSRLEQSSFTMTSTSKKGSLNRSKVYTVTTTSNKTPNVPIIISLMFSGPVDLKLTGQLFFSVCTHLPKSSNLARNVLHVEVFPYTALFKWTCLSKLSKLSIDRIQKAMMKEGETTMMKEGEITRTRRTLKSSNSSELFITLKVNFLDFLMHKICLRRIRLHPASPHLINFETTLASSFKQPLALWIQLTFIITFVESLQSSTNSSAASSRGSTSSYQVPPRLLRGVHTSLYRGPIYVRSLSVPGFGHPLLCPTPQVTQRASFLKIRRD